MTYPQQWQEIDNKLERKFTFQTFPQALEFIMKVGDIAQKLDHHPEIYNSYNKVTVTLSTHSENAITDKDIELAEAIDVIA